MIVAGAEFIKRLKKLDEQLFIVEGEKFVNEISDGWEIEYYLITEEFAASHMQLVTLEFEPRAKVHVTRRHLFDKIARTETPQGILAVCRKRSFTLDFARERGLWLLCENIQDPGNVGTLIRAAAAAGANGVMLCGACCDVYNPKAIRASAGCVFRVPTAKVTSGDIVRELRGNHVTMIAAVARDGSLPYDLDMKSPCCIMTGNEAHGLSAGLIDSANYRARLPMVAAESLNAAVAGAVLLYEAVRQRIS